MPFVLPTFPSCFASVTVCTPDDAFSYLCVQNLHTPVTCHQFRERFCLVSNVVKIQHNHINLSTIYTWMRFEILTKILSFLIPKSSLTLSGCLWVSFVKRLQTTPMTETTPSLVATFHPSVFIELTLIFIEFAVSTKFGQTFGG